MKHSKRSVLFVFFLFSAVFLLSRCSEDTPSEPITDTTPPPSPTNLTVTQQSQGLALDWDIPLIDGEPVPDLRGYRIYRDPEFSTAAKQDLADGKNERAPEQDSYIFVLESQYLDRSVVQGQSYGYSVTALDDSLNESDAAESDYYVYDTGSPVVTITSPVAGYVTNVATVTVEGTVTDSQVISSANIYVNDVIVTQAAVVAGAFSSPVTLTYGDNALKADATDPNGNVGTSSVVTVVLDTSAVVVQITSPEDGTLTSQERVEIAGVVSDPAITQGTLVVNEDERSIVIQNGSFGGVFADLDEGMNTIEVRATNQAGSSGSSGIVRVTRDSQQPAVYLIEPVDGATVQESPIYVSGTVTDANPPDSVSLSVAGSIRNLALVQGQFQAYADLEEGSNSVIVTATDLAGNTGSTSASVTLNSEGPVVRITTPQDGSLHNDPTINVGGTVSDTAIETGTLFVSGTPQQVAIESGIFLQEVELQTDGEHRFWMEVVDAYERPGVSDTIGITLDTTAPGILITTPADGSQGNVTPISVAGTVDDEEVDEVTVVVNGFGVDASVSNGSFSTTVALAEGWNDISARGTDVAGNTGYSDTVTVMLDTQAEILEVDHDAAGVVLEVGDHVLFWLDAGEAGGQSSVDIGDIHTGILLYDNGTNGDPTAGDGKYYRDYTVQAGDEAVNEQVIGHFTDHVGNVALDQVAPNDITINTPPAAVTLIQPGWTDVSSAAVNLTWTASTALDFQDYRLYRSVFPGVDSLSTLIATITQVGVDSVTYTDEDPSFTGGSTWYYRVYVRDQLGASVGSNEVSATIDNWPTDQKLIIPGEYPAYMAKLDNGSGRYVFVSHMTTPGHITILNHVTDGIVKTLDVPGRTVGIASNQYTETLVAGFDEDMIYRIHGFDLDFSEPAVEVGLGPWDVASAWGPGDSLYAFTGIGSNENSPDDSIAVINLWTGALDYKFHSGGVHYSHFGASPDGFIVYAASPHGTVAIIDPEQWRISQVFGGYQPIFDLIVTEGRIYLPHATANQVSILNRYTMQLERTLTAQGGPVYCLELPGLPYLYVACQTQGVIRIYSTQTWQQIDSISIAVPTCMVANDAGDKLYVTRLGSGGGVVVFGY